MLFADIVEFTKFSEGASAEVLAGVLDDFSARLDGERRLRRREQREERTIGDAYLASVDFPSRSPTTPSGWPTRR